MTGIIAFIARNRWAQGLALVLFMLLLVYGLDRCASYAMRSMQESATTAGAAVQRERDLTETVNRMEKADETRVNVRDERSSAAYDECVLTARTPENCVRFLPK